MDLAFTACPCPPYRTCAGESRGEAAADAGAVVGAGVRFDEDVPACVLDKGVRDKDDCEGLGTSDKDGGFGGDDGAGKGRRRSGCGGGGGGREKRARESRQEA